MWNEYCNHAPCWRRRVKDSQYCQEHAGWTEFCAKTFCGNRRHKYCLDHIQGTTTMGPNSLTVYHKYSLGEIVEWSLGVGRIVGIEFHVDSVGNVVTWYEMHTDSLIEEHNIIASYTRKT